MNDWISDIVNTLCREWLQVLKYKGDWNFSKIKSFYNSKHQFFWIVLLHYVSEIVMTPSKHGTTTSIRIEKVKKSQVDPANVAHTAGGQHRGLVINKQAASGKCLLELSNRFYDISMYYLCFWEKTPSHFGCCCQLCFVTLICSLILEVHSSVLFCSFDCTSINSTDLVISNSLIANTFICNLRSHRVTV